MGLTLIGLEEHLVRLPPHSIIIVWSDYSDGLFTDSCGERPVQDGASPVVTPETTTTYYAQTKNAAGGGSETCAAVTVTVNAHVAADFNNDCSVDGNDLAVFAGCLSGPTIPRADTPDCGIADFDHDEDVDQADFGLLQRCYSGAGKPTDPDCAN